MSKSSTKGLREANSVYVLSLDLTMTFQVELGLVGVLSASVQETARKNVLGFCESAEADRDPSNLVEQFNTDMDSESDIHALTRLRCWEESAFPEQYKLGAQIFTWSLLLEYLRQLWDSQPDAADHPLSAPDVSWARLAIRDYRDHSHNVRLEVGTASDRSRSRWDVGIQRKCEGWFDGAILVTDAINARAAEDLWFRVAELDIKEIEGLELWARSAARPDCIPLTPQIRVPDFSRKVRKLTE